MKKTYRYWNKENVFEEAKKYQSRTEFARNSSGAYDVARRHGWFDDYTWFEEVKKPSGYWNYEHCYQEALKYQSRTDFQKGSNGAYKAALKNGWLKDYAWFVDGKVKMLTDKNDSVYRYYWEETNAIYIGRTLMYRQNERINEHQADTDTVGKYAKENGLAIPPMEIIEENITPIEGLKREDYWVNYYKEKGYNVLNKAKTGVGSGSLGAINKGKWNKKTVFEEAKKYKTRSEFRQNASRAYQVALKNKWVSEMDWFEEVRKTKGYWNKENVFKEAKKYKTKKEFSNGCSSAYDVSLKRGWLSEMNWFNGNKHWDKENVFEEGKKYKTRYEFKKSCNRAYQVARKNKWLDILFPAKNVA